MSKIWAIVMNLALSFALLTGRGGDAGDTLLRAGREAILLAVTLTGGMTVFSGLMEVLRDCGDLERLGRVMRRLLQPVMGVKLTESSWSAMAMNLSANLLGMGNAATPFGIRAAQSLAAEGEAGMKALCWLLVLNNSGLELMPVAVIALRQSAGSVSPSDVWLPTLAVTAITTAVAVVLLVLTERPRRGRA